MTRRHPVHDTVRELTRTQHQTIQVLPTLAYQVTAPSLLGQLADAVGLGTEGGGRGIPGSRPNVAVDALDLWTEILTSVHRWADVLDLDRRPYLTPPGPERARADRDAYVSSSPWWTSVDPAAATLLTELPPDRRPPATRRQIITTPPPELPPMARLLRLVAATAVGTGRLAMADTIDRVACRWRDQISELLTGRAEQRGIRGATCPNIACTGLCARHHHPTRWCAEDDCCPAAGCQPTVVVEEGSDGTRTVRPAIVLTVRKVPGAGVLRWLTCQACDWTQGAEDLAYGMLRHVLVDVVRRLAALRLWPSRAARRVPNVSAAP